MKNLSIFISLFVLAVSGYAFTGFSETFSEVTEESGQFYESALSNDLEIANNGTSDAMICGGPYVPNPYNEGSVLWSVEDWHGSYGAICEDVDVSGDGNYTLSSWNLNYEKWELYNSDTGVLEWTFDPLDGGKYVGGSINADISDDGSVIAGCIAGWAESYGEDYKGTLLKFSDASSTPDWTYDFPYINADQNLSSRPVDVKVTPDGSKIVCLVRNITDDPTKPHQLYIFNSSSSTPTLTIDIPNTDENPNGLDITDDASLITYATYKNAYVYDDSGAQINAFSVDHGWQYAPAIAPDGDWLAYGNYHGELRLYEWDGSEFTSEWQYTVPPDHYYPWVIAIDIVDDTVMMGTSQTNASSNRGFAYIFDTSSSTPTWISDDFGDSVRDVSLSGDGLVGLAASYGPQSGNGWRSAFFMTDSSTPYFVLDQTYPGSHLACELSNDGSIGATGGKRVHAYEMGSGGWVYCVESIVDTATDNGEPVAPLGFSLSSAYPNPSSDTATISFALPHTNTLDLSLFDIKGRKISTLASGEFEAGEHTIEVNGVSAGIYLYRLEADEYSDTKKMVVK